MNGLDKVKNKSFLFSKSQFVTNAILEKLKKDEEIRLQMLEEEWDKYNRKCIRIMEQIKKLKAIKK